MRIINLHVRVRDGLHLRAGLVPVPIERLAAAHRANRELAFSRTRRWKTELGDLDLLFRLQWST